MNWTLLYNSLLVASAATLLACGIGFAVALVAVASSQWARKILFAASLISFALPPFLVANTWLHFFGLTGVWRPYLDWNVYSLSGSIVLLALLLWPISFFFSVAALNRIESALLEAEPMLGGWALLRHLLFPLSAPALRTASVITFVLALNNFGVPALLQTKVYPAEVWVNFNTNFNYAQALALSWPLVLGPLALIWYFHRKPLRLAFKSSGLNGGLVRERLGPWRWPIGVIAALALSLSVLLPVGQLVGDSGTWREFMPAFEAGHRALANSFLFAAGSALICLVFALVTRRLKVGLWSWVLFLAPGVLLGMLLIWALNRPIFNAFYTSYGIVFLAYALRHFAPAWSGVTIALSATDPLLDDFAKLHGASAWQRFWNIEFPQIRGQLAAVFYIVFLLVLWDVETLVLLVPPGTETASLRVFNMLHYGHATQVNALCIWLLLLALAPIGCWWAVRAARCVRFVELAPVMLVGLLLSGCGGSPQGDVAIKSQYFSAVKVFGTRGAGTGQFNKPRSIAVDRDDNFYVVDMTGRVQKFSPEGPFILQWQMPQTDKGKPKGMVRDQAGNIIVVEPHYSRVNHFKPNGQLVTQWGKDGRAPGELAFPRSVAVNSRGEVYVSEYGLVERVQRFGPFGKNFINSIGGPGDGDAQFNRAEGIGIDMQDNIFVADSCNHRVQIFTREGNFVSAFGKPGSRSGELSYPYDVRVDNASLRFVCEFGNSRVQIFDPQNRPLEILGGVGAEPGQMNNPWSIALDSRGNLYVADSGNHRVLKFIRKGAYPQLTGAGAQQVAGK
jgi:ABC-type Fe3+ transport system permease subunit/DNA-binding beta-propeller fold protein YncE